MTTSTHDSADTDETRKRSVKTIRMNGISAAIWENPPREDGDSPLYLVTFTRTYRDAEGEFHDTPTHTVASLLTLAKIAYEAHTCVIDLYYANRQELKSRNGEASNTESDSSSGVASGVTSGGTSGGKARPKARSRSR